MDRSKDWLREAARNPQQAQSSLDNEFYELACFLSQQAAENAVKAVGQAKKVDLWGHMISRLLPELAPTVKAPTDIMDAAKSLDHQLRALRELAESGNMLIRRMLREGEVLAERA